VEVSADECAALRLEDRVLVITVARSRKAADSHMPMRGRLQLENPHGN
jgi:hypothetical protein